MIYEFFNKENRVYHIKNQINSAPKNKMIEHYESEYCYCRKDVLWEQYLKSSLARNSWLSKISSWCYQMTSIYGIRLTFCRSIIDPCIPRNWNLFKIKRKYNKILYPSLTVGGNIYAFHRMGEEKCIISSLQLIFIINFEEKIQ